MLVAAFFVFGTGAVWGQTITITNLSDNTICQNASAIVTIGSTGVFNPLNVYSIELSDENGSFASPTIIGSISDFSNGPLNITITIPSPISGSTNYLIRGTSSDPVMVGSNYGITIYSQLSSGAHNIDPLIVCENFNPAILEINTPLTSGGQAPYSYQWYINMTPVGSNLPSFDPGNIMAPGHYEYYCVVTDACNQSSETIHKIIDVEADPTITISGGGTVCEGDAPLLTSVRQGGAGTYTYLWESGQSTLGPWTEITGEISSTYSPSTSTPGTFYYQVRLISNGAACNNSLDVEELVVNALPDPPTGTSPQVFCAIDLPILTDISVSGTAIQWYAASSGGTPLPTTTTLINGITYYASQIVDGCESDTRLPVTVTLTPDNSIALTSAVGTDAQSVCINTTITPITYSTTGATGATVTNLPAGVTGSWASDIVTITGTPTVAGAALTYTITLTGGCGTIITTGSIAVTANNTLTLTSGAGTDAQTVCINSPITPITYTTTGATGATITNLPAGVTGAWAGNVITISGTPTVAGAALTYTITLTGGCGTISTDGTVAVTANNTLTLTSGAGTDAQSVCINTPITPITYTTTGATGATVTNLPAGVTGSWAGNVVTISGTPTVAGAALTYTITLTGGCGTISTDGTVAVTANNTLTLTSGAGTDAQTVCINTPITPITYTTTGATGANITNLPAGVTGSWAGNVVTISGTPTVAGAALTYTITLTGGCGTITTTGSIAVTANNTITLSSAAGTNSQTVCINTPITPITYTTTGATGATITNLPAGVSGSWAGNIATISGTPTVAGAALTYTVTLTGGCGTISTTGTIAVTANNTLTLTSGAGTDAQFVCINNPITPITYTTTGATGATFTNLPAGVTGSWAGNIVTISGTPTVAGAALTYTVTLTGGCGTISTDGTIAVTANNTLTLTSGAGTDAQTVCINTPITPITYTTTGATGAAITNLPAGVTGSWAGNIITISGTPTVAGAALTYSITLTGGCGTISTTGTIAVTANNTLTLTSGAGTDAQSVCINTPITSITYITTGATGATITNLPAGVTGSWAGNIITISGTPTVASAALTYSITLTGGCGTISSTGTIIVNPIPVVSWTNPLANQCTNSTPYILSGGTPAGGIYSGPGVSGINFNALLAGIGTHTLTYTYADIHGCIASATNTIVVNDLPSASISYAGSPYCAAGTAIVTLAGQGGGTYGSSPGLNLDAPTGNINLATSTPGTYTVTYIFTNPATGCSNTTTTTVIVNPLPTAIIAYTAQPYCATGNATVTINGQTGGTFTGTAGLSINPSTGVIDLATSTTGIFHTVTYTFSDGTCSNSTTTQILIFPLPTATITYPGGPFCATGTVAVVRTGQENGIYTSPSLTINSTTGTINLATSPPGAHTVTYTFTDGRCTNTATTSITINPLPTATIAYTAQPYCATGNATVTINGQTGGTFTGTAGLSINPSTGVIDLAASTTGIMHTVTYNFSDGTCSNSTTTQILIFPLPVATIIYPGGPFCATGTVAVVRTGQENGLYTSPVLNINATTGTINLATSPPGVHTVTYTFTDGRCTNTATTTVTVNPLPTATIAYTAQPYCATGNATVTITGQTGGTFTGTAGLSINTSTGVIDLAASTTGITHTVTYTFSDGTCSNSTTTQILVFPLPVATISYPGDPFCATGTVAVVRTGQANGTYTSPVLNINATTGTINLATSPPGTHTVTYTFSDGRCTNTTTTTVTVNPLPTATIAYTAQPYCATGYAPPTITGQNGGAFTGTAGLSINTSTGVIDLAASTTGITHTVTYTFSDGTCPNSTTTQILIFPLPVATIAYPGGPFCTTGTVAVVRTGQENGLYTSPSLDIHSTLGTIDLSTSPPGTHIVNYTFTDGRCTNTATTTIVITQLPAATISYPGTPFCTSVSTSQNVTITGTGAYSGGTFTAAPAGLTIDAGTGAITPSSSASGTYTVTYTIPASGGCPSIPVTTTVIITALPTASISYSGNPFCNSISSQQDVTISGTGVYTGGTYSASPSGLVLIPATGAIIPSTSTPRTYTVTYTIPAAGGCTSVVTTTSVTITALPTATISYASAPFCTSLSAPQNVTISGTGAYTGGTYSAAPAGLTLNSTTGAITPVSSTPGTYIVTYTIPSSGGCAVIPVTTTVVITALPTVSISYSGSPFCSTITNSQPVTMTGTGSYTGGTFSSAPAGLTINLSTGAITPGTSTPRTYTVTYTLPASGGCGAVIATTSLTVTAAPTATISYSGTPFCTTLGTPQTVTISGTGTFAGGSYSATPTGLTINPSTGTITPGTSTPGTYVVTYTIPTTGGCPAIPVTTNVTVTALPTAVINYSRSPFCKSWTAETVTLSGTGAYTGGTYSASPAGLSINASTGTINPNASTAGTYTVTYVTPVSGGCASVSATTTVIVRPEFVAPVICCSQFFCVFNDPSPLTIVTPTGGYGNNVTYRWRRRYYFFGWSAWTNITGATGPTYTPPAEILRYQYQLIVTDTGCTGASLTSNNVEISFAISISGTFTQSVSPIGPYCPDANFTYHIESVSLASLAGRSLRYNWSVNPQYLTTTAVPPVGVQNGLIWMADIPFTTHNNTGATVTTTITVTPTVYNPDNSVVCILTPETFNITILPYLIECPDDIDLDIVNPALCSLSITTENPTYNNCVSPGDFTWTMTGATTGSGNGFVGTHEFNLGTTIVTYTATNSFGTSSVCSFNVTVSDPFPPDLDCPDDISVNSDPDLCAAVVNYDLPDISENCVAATVTISQTGGLASGSVFPIGETINTFVATDASGNISAPCSFTVTVVDAQDPDILCPGPVSVSCPSEIPAHATDYASFVAAGGIAIDNCTQVTVAWISDIVSNQTCNNRYLVTRTYRASDTAGNSSTCEQIITVNDQAPPVIQTIAGSLNDSFECSDAAAIASALAMMPTAIDNCGEQPTMVLLSDITTNAPGCPNGYTRVRTWNFVDNCGNTSPSFIQTLIVDDNTLPVLTSGSIAACYPTVAAAETAAISATSVTDNCAGNITLTANTAGGCAAVVTVTATDVCGNQASTSYNTRIDNLSPTVYTGSIAPCFPTVAAAQAAALSVTSATDNCTSGGQITFTASTTGTCPAIITITATDACGNIGTSTSTTVIDNTPPVITAGTISACYPTRAEAEAAALAATTAADNCSAAVTFGVSSSGSCGAVVTVSATDACGNRSQITYNTRIDNAPPTITTGTIAPCYPTVVAAQAAALAATTVNDNCSAGAQIILSASTVGTCPATITITATDFCGLSATTSYTTVIDNTPPVITAGTISACYPTRAEAEAAALAATTAADNCSAAVTFGVSSSGSCGAVVTVSATDACGNRSQITYNTRIDNAPPTITTGTIAPCYPTVVAAQAAALAATTVNDNCSAGAQIILSASTVGTCPATITITATDFCGLSATTSYTTVIDNTPPVITAGTISACYPTRAEAEAAALAATTAADNCSAAVTFGVSSSGSCGAVVTVSATDACGNRSQITYNTRIDNAPPTITTGTIAPCYPTVVAAQAAALAATTVNDNCSAGAQIILSASTVGTCPATITITAVDCCGLSVHNYIQYCH